jgi:sporulation protein YlmC with PRC-barrel domain
LCEAAMSGSTFRFVRQVAAIILFLPSLLIWGVVAYAQIAHTNPNRLIGAPVFAADGMKVGQVADVLIRDGGRVDRLRIVTGIPLGFGQRTVEIPANAFTIRDGVVMLDLSGGEVDAFPSISAHEEREQPKHR